MKAGNIAKNFLKNLGVQAAIGLVRGYLLEQMKNITASDLYEAVINNENLWSVTPSNIKAWGIRQKSKFGGIFKQYESEINTELILKWLQEDRPDLFSTLINIPEEYGQDAGIRWLHNQVLQIKQQIINM